MEFLIRTFAFVLTVLLENEDKLKTQHNKSPLPHVESNSNVSQIYAAKNNQDLCL